MLTITINSLEGIDLDMVDIQGAYFCANMVNEVHMVFKVTVTNLMVAADPELYLPFISYARGQAVMYVHLQKSLYGCLKISLLFCEKILGDMEACRFKINLYDPCVVS